MTGIARAMEFLALSLYALQELGLPYLVTIIFAARMLPMSLLGIVIGTISERVSPISVIKLIYALSNISTGIAILLVFTDNFNVIDKPIETTSDKDHLTQMYNRQTLEVKINELIRKSNKNNVESTLILVDIDKFSELNYSYGHSVGDQLIVHVSEIIEHCLKNKSYNKNHAIYFWFI